MAVRERIFRRSFAAIVFAPYRFRDEAEVAAGLQDSEDFAHVTGQVGPPEVSFNGRDEIEHALRKRNLRHGAVRISDERELSNVHSFFYAAGRFTAQMLRQRVYQACGLLRVACHPTTISDRPRPRLRTGDEVQIGWVVFCRENA